MSEVSEAQQAVCDRFGVPPVAAAGDLKVGISLNLRDGLRPVKAMRHLPVGDTTGWFIWGGDIEPSEHGDDFFVPLHVSHVLDWCPEIVPYLALPPGWGVIVEPGYEDVWFDPEYLVE